MSQETLSTSSSTSSSLQLYVKCLTPDAKPPTYGSSFAAGMDIYSNQDIDILPSSRYPVSTGIAVKWEGNEAENYYLRVAPRSGLSVKSSIDVGAGVIDYDYRGEIMVCFINSHLHNPYRIQKGDKIAQLILTKIERPEIITVVNWDFNETNRGIQGFGSTGQV